MKRERKKMSNMEQAIDANLRRAYEDVANQDVPDRFTELLNQLREAEKHKAENQND
ncbi:NepR family anti-sigma factor [Marivita sp. GX14005]|uniref:NepR family anti-sigma factor n=1 Tax=Marivita sp. GX14005 TaxID=2942276 RepID=UPI002018DA62|nr:NepR family anti-sigma factor [Marivita sp. GX14005]MCL3880734.1 hypothetical protein [Marivita sp. GX14005]